ncbi:MAG: GGDEF domain-containing protein [Actinomycetota bacterium]|nr:GGDEF domain-containing protein [Actinomycetota bacterium]
MILDCLGGEHLVHAGAVLSWSETFCSLMMAGEPSMAPVLDAVPAYAALRDRTGLPLRAVMSVPIIDRQGGLFGTLCGFSTSDKPKRILVEEPTVRLWADLLGLILTNELAVDQQVFRASRAERAAETDPLTGLGNRRLWDRLLGLEEERCRRYGSPAAVVIVDLDDLKAVNDELGHAAGDAHLQRVGRCLRSVLPAEAQAARVGGDEFAILATECDRARGEELARMVRRALNEAGLSASTGLGVRTLDVDMTGAWRHADREMYRAKRRARSSAGLAAGGWPMSEARWWPSTWPGWSPPRPRRPIRSTSCSS